MGERRGLRVLVVGDEDGRHAHQVAEEVLGTGPVGERQAGLLAQIERQQLERPQRQSGDLHDRVLPVMTADLPEAQPLFLREVADLEGVASGQDDLVTSLLQFADDGDEEGDMGRVVEVDPDLHAGHRGVRIVPTQARLRQGFGPLGRRISRDGP